MPTDNPKVSAYVPQIIKDRLSQFREEQDISESQAVTIILAEYFGLSEMLARSPQSLGIGGVTLARIEALEQEFSSFTKSVEQRLQELTESINKSSEPLTNSEPIQLELPQVKETNDSGLLNELPAKVKQAEKEDESDASLLSELPSESQQEIKPIPGTKLSEIRFGRSKDTLAGVKRKMTIERFTEWTREQDPDDIAWKYVESPSKGYIPVDELPNELKSRLLAWIKENID
jgi:hypothetical protein